jgi:hypothetical protein
MPPPFGFLRRWFQPYEIFAIFSHGFQPPDFDFRFAFTPHSRFSLFSRQADFIFAFRLRYQFSFTAEEDIFIAAGFLSFSGFTLTSCRPPFRRARCARNRRRR